MAKTENQGGTPARVRAQRSTNEDDKQPGAEAEADEAEEGDEAEAEADEAEEGDDQQGDGEDNAEDGEDGGTSEADSAEGDTDPAEDPTDTDAASEASKPVQAGFAKRAGRESTAPLKKLAAIPRPYLDSPREFGIHIEGHLVRFKAGRTPITDEHFDHHELSAEQVLDALKTDSYVADNGAEIIE